MYLQGQGEGKREEGTSGMILGPLPFHLQETSTAKPWGGGCPPMGEATRRSLGADETPGLGFGRFSPSLGEASYTCEQDPKPSSSPKIVTTHRLGLRSKVDRDRRVHLMNYHHQL